MAGRDVLGEICHCVRLRAVKRRLRGEACDVGGGGVLLSGGDAGCSRAGGVSDAGGTAAAGCTHGAVLELA